MAGQPASGAAAVCQQIRGGGSYSISHMMAAALQDAVSHEPSKQRPGHHIGSTSATLPLARPLWSGLQRSSAASCAFLWVISKCKLGVGRFKTPLFQLCQRIVISSGRVPPPMSLPLPLAGGSCESEGLAACPATVCSHGAQRRPGSQTPSHSASCCCLHRVALATWPRHLHVRQCYQLIPFVLLRQKCCDHQAPWPCCLRLTKGSQLNTCPVCFPFLGRDTAVCVTLHRMCLLLVCVLAGSTA